MGEDNNETKMMMTMMTMTSSPRSNDDHDHDHDRGDDYSMSHDNSFTEGTIMSPLIPSLSSSSSLTTTRTRTRTINNGDSVKEEGRNNDTPSNHDNANGNEKVGDGNKDRYHNNNKNQNRIRNMLILIIIICFIITLCLYPVMNRYQAFTTIGQLKTPQNSNKTTMMITTGTSSNNNDNNTGSTITDVDIHPLFLPTPWQRLSIPNYIPSPKVIYEDPSLFQNTIYDFTKSQNEYRWESFVTVPEVPIPDATKILNRVIAGHKRRYEMDANDPNHPLLHCPPTTQIKIYVPKKMENDEGEGEEEPAPYWLIQSLDEHGNPKNIGGDEFYITYNDQNLLHKPADEEGLVEHPTAVGFTEDFGNGWYKVTFVVSFMNGGKTKINELSGYGYLAVNFIYTCGMGNIPPPAKEKWIFGGAIASKYIIRNVIPPIIYHPWKYHNRNVTTGEKIINLSTSYDVINAIGDSVMGHWAEKYRKIKRSLKFQKPLNTSTIPLLLNEMDEFYGADLNRSLPPTNDRVALIMSSSTWDVCNPPNRQPADWADHRVALRILVRHVKEHYPKVDFFWKLPTALQIHVPIYRKLKKAMTFTYNDYDRPKFTNSFTNRLKYMSDVRARTLYKYQMNIMEEYNIPVMDMYLLTYVSADYLRLGDGRHYTNWFNEVTMKHYGGIPPK